LTSFDIDGYKLQASLGPGQGAAIYFKNDLVKICHEMIVQSTYQILKVVFRDFDVLAVYRSSTSNTDHFPTSLTSLVTRQKQVFILGGRNDPGHANGKIQLCLAGMGFQQHVNWRGNILDHIYANYTGDCELICNATVRPAFL
jgi:hypothetical protein